MAAKNFFKENFVLVVGIALPILLMVGFMVAASLPQTITDPPKYDLIFAISDYQSSAGHPLNVQLVVKSGVLKAQYTKNPPNTGSTWKKLYRFDANTQKVSELTFGLPADAADIEGMKEETVEATAGLRLDTTLQSPDGYTLSNEGYYNHSGLLNDVFWGGSYSNEQRLRKGGASIKLSAQNGAVYYYNSLEFVGWVTGKN